MIKEGDDRINEISSLYLSTRFEDALEGTRGLVTHLEGTLVLSVKLKNEALLYIYLIEWAIIASTCMFTGMVIWSLMVKRRLYADVKSTKLTKSLEDGRSSSYSP